MVPLLMLQNGPDASASVSRSTAGTAAEAAHRPPAHHATFRDFRRTTRHATHRAGRPAGQTPVVIASAPVRDVVPTTTSTVPATTTTTVPPTTTTTTTTLPTPVAGDQVQVSGIVTYYDHPAGRCASPWLPFGTVVRITNPANGLSVTCVVDDREADRSRSIDLSTATFAELAPLWQGVIYARLSW